MPEQTQRHRKHRYIIIVLPCEQQEGIGIAICQHARQESIIHAKPRLIIRLSRIPQDVILIIPHMTGQPAPRHHKYEREEHIARHIVLLRKVPQSVRIHSTRAQLPSHRIQYGKRFLWKHPARIKFDQKIQLPPLGRPFGIGLPFQCKQVGKPLLRMNLLHSIVDHLAAVLCRFPFCQHQRSLCRHIRKPLRVDGAQRLKCFLRSAQIGRVSAYNPRTNLPQNRQILLFRHKHSPSYLIEV